MRLIDSDCADKLAKDLFKGQIGITFYQAVHAMLESISTVDAIPVVHCKDCRFLGVKDLGDGYCKKKMAGIISPYDFCSYGERKDEK